MLLTCLSIICKLMEKLVKNQRVSHMTKNKLFSKKQFGFISGRSTTLQLLKVMNEWTEILDNGGSIDSVDHSCKLSRSFCRLVVSLWVLISLWTFVSSAKRYASESTWSGISCCSPHPLLLSSKPWLYGYALKRKYLFCSTVLKTFVYLFVFVLLMIFV
jgi:hypothetical protein